MEAQRQAAMTSFASVPSSITPAIISTPRKSFQSAGA